MGRRNKLERAKKLAKLGPWEARQKIPPLSAKLHKIDDIDNLPDAEALADNIDHRRADVLTKYRARALEKYISDSKKYWAGKEKRDKAHLKVLRKTHEDYRLQYEANMEKESKKTRIAMEQIRAENQHRRNRYADDYNRKLAGMHNKEKLMRQFTEVEKHESAHLEERLLVISHEAARVKKDFHAYEEMSKERDGKTQAVRTQTEQLRNRTYKKLILKEKDSKKIKNKTDALIKQLHIDAQNLTNYTKNRSEFLERKVKLGQFIERAKKHVAEKKHKVETEKKMKADKKRYEEEQTKQKKEDDDMHQKRKKQLDAALKKYMAYKKQTIDAQKKHKEEIITARKKDEEDQKAATKKQFEELKKEQEEKKKNEDEVLKKEKEEKKKADEFREKANKAADDRRPEEA